MEYLTWNDLLAGYFFKPDGAGKRVYLSVDSSVIEELGRRAVDPRDDYVAAVRAGPPWVTRKGICQKALQAMSDWRTKRLQYPPYVGYLGFFVLAAGLEGDFAAHAYYPRLRTLLGEEPVIGQYPSFDRMLELWDDLERWANEDRRGELGEFRADIAGGWINVGLPVAQVILTEQERVRLHTIFAEAGLDPMSSPSDEQLSSLMLARGQHRLRARTMQLLQSDPDGNSEVRDLLLSTALEELHEWDGELNVEEGRDAEIYGTLRLSCRVDRIAKRVQFSLRCRSRHDLPEEGMGLRLDGVQETLKCSDYVMGWSRELTTEADSQVFDGAKIDWSAGCWGTAGDLGWRFRLPASDVRVFEDGAAYSIPGIVEVPRLQKERPFYLTCHSRAAEPIEAWGKSQSNGFTDLRIEAGLPAGWKFYYSSGATNDELIRRFFPALAFNSTVRVYFEDGVRSTANQYFSFGLPQVVIDGASDGVEVYCDGTLLQAGEDGRYSIPQGVIRSGRLAIEVKRDDSVITRRSLFVSDEVPVTGGCTFTGNRFGRAFDRLGDEPFVSGAAGSFEVPPFNVVFLPEAQAVGRRIFVGRVPGQIISLPNGERPSEWDPVWAILLHRRGSVTFCGSGLRESAVVQGRAGGRRELEEWKRVLWHRRKRIVPPSHEGLKRLWQAYQEEARKI